MATASQILKHQIASGAQNHDRYTFPELIDITSLGLQQDTIFTGCAFRKGFTATNHSTNIKLKFLDCTVDATVSFEHANFTQLEFEGCTFSKGLQIIHLNATKILIDRCTVHNACRISQPKVDSFFITKTIVNGEVLQIASPAISTLHLDVYKGDAPVRIHNFLGDKDARIHTLSINFGPDFNSQLVLGKIEVENLKMDGYNRSTSVAILDVTVMNIICSYFTNHGVIKVNNLTTENQYSSNLFVLSSYLGELDLNNLDLSSFQSVIVDSSNITSLVPTNVTWCKALQAQMESEPNFQKNREVYRQMKNVMIANHDKQNELKYRALEMEAYRRLLKAERNSLWDRLILWTNRVSNNHGVSWARALGWLLAANAIVFISLKVLICFNCFVALSFLKGVSQFIILLNPVHDLTAVFGDVSGYKPNVVSIVDSLMRVLNSYLLFQFIRAFRKFTG